MKRLYIILSIISFLFLSCSADVSNTTTDNSKENEIETPVTLIGTNARGCYNGIGDILFDDFSSETYSPDLVLTDYQKSHAIAVMITYNCGIGLKQGYESWCTEDATLYKNYFCNDANYQYNTWNDNRDPFYVRTEFLKYLGASETTDSSGKFVHMENYPALLYCINYLHTRTSFTWDREDYRDAYCLPTYMQLKELTFSKYNGAYDIISDALRKCDGEPLHLNELYWTAGLHPSAGLDSSHYESYKELDFNGMTLVFESEYGERISKISDVITRKTFPHYVLPVISKY